MKPRLLWVEIEKHQKLQDKHNVSHRSLSNHSEIKWQNMLLRIFFHFSGKISLVALFRHVLFKIITCMLLRKRKGICCSYEFFLKLITAFNMYYNIKSAGKLIIQISS